MTTYTPENRITIIDNQVIIDGYAANVDCSAIDDIRCIQWDVKNQRGELEYHDGTPNKTLINIGLFQTFIDQACEQIAQAVAEEKKQTEYLNSFDYQQAAFIESINEAAENFVNTVINSSYPDFEKLTFATQQKEAYTWQADNNASTPNLDVIANARGLDRVTLIQKVLKKADTLERVSFQIAGQRQAKVQQAEAATTVSELQAIDLQYSLAN